MPRPGARVLFLATSILIACTRSPSPAARPTPVATHVPRPAPSVAPKESSPLVAVVLPPERPLCPSIDVQLPEVAREDGVDVETPELEDPGETLAPFYEKLAAVMRGTAKDHVRIAMYGDSNLTMDWITGHMRRWWQGRFGDAGHGWVSMGKPWEWYHHMDVRHGAGLSSWIHFAVSTNPPSDRLIGFAGIAAQSIGATANAYVQTADEGAPIGASASHFEVYWLSRPNAGSFKVTADGEVLAEIDARADAPAAGFRAFELPDARHRLSLVATSKAPVRVFGVTLERGAPGVIVDSLGCGALSARHMADREDRALNEAMLAHRGYDLVLELVGTNMFEPLALADEWATVVATHRAARPGVPIVLMSPPDTATSLVAPHSDRRIVDVAERKRQIAASQGVAFWDFRAAMGGELSIVRFYRHKMAWGDLIHFTERGAAYMADRIDLALMRGLARWLEKHPDAGCP